MAELRVTAESDEGLVRATVGGRGQLLNLKLDRRVFLMDPAELGRTIVDTVQEAAELATGQVQAIMAGYLPPDSGSMRFLKDQDFGSLLRRQDEIMREARGE